MWMSLALLVILALGLWFATRIPKTIAIFVIAAFIASAVHPVAEWLTKRRVPRLWAIALVYAVLVIVTIVLLVIIVPMTADQVQILVQSAPQDLHNVQTWLQGAQGALRAH